MRHDALHKQIREKNISQEHSIFTYCIQYLKMFSFAVVHNNITIPNDIPLDTRIISTNHATVFTFITYAVET